MRPKGWKKAERPPVVDASIIGRRLPVVAMFNSLREPCDRKEECLQPMHHACLYGISVAAVVVQESWRTFPVEPSSGSKGFVVGFIR